MPGVNAGVAHCTVNQCEHARIMIGGVTHARCNFARDLVIQTRGGADFHGSVVSPIVCHGRFVRRARGGVLARVTAFRNYLRQVGGVYRRAIRWGRVQYLPGVYGKRL